jgi:hypothetical protein
MKPASNDALARQHAGEPSPVRHWSDNRHNPPRRSDLTEVERQIAGLANRSTQDLRVAWRQLHRTGPPLGLSRDLMIRALAHQLQEQSYGGISRVLRRRLQSLAGASEKATVAVDRDLVLKAGTTLVRQWRGHTHTVVVRNDGFEHEGQLYRSLTAIAERITEAHWSGPRFFGLTKRPGASAGAEARHDEVSGQRHTAERKGSLRHLHPQILRGGARTGIQFAACATRGLRGLYHQPAPRRLGVSARWL